MTTLIAVYNSDGCVGRCDAKCYDARPGSSCDCVCGGANHAVGRAQAEANSMAMVARMVSDYREAHPELTIERFKALLALPLFEK